MINLIKKWLVNILMLLSIVWIVLTSATIVYILIGLIIFGPLPTILILLMFFMVLRVYKRVHITGPFMIYQLGEFQICNCAVENCS